MRYSRAARRSWSKADSTDVARRVRQTFKTACLAAGFYQFPSAKWLDTLFSQVPDDFRLSLEVQQTHRGGTTFMSTADLKAAHR